MKTRIDRWVMPALLALAVLLPASWHGMPCRAESPAGDGPSQRPLRVVVMDPLSKQLACDCVAGYAQRDYGRLGEFLQGKLGRPVEIDHCEALTPSLLRDGREIDLVIGKFSVVVSDAEKVKLPVRTLAMLTGKDGSITQTGLFVVRQADRAGSIEDLQGYRLLFGPEDSQEKRSAPLAALEAFDVPPPSPIQTRSACNTAALAVVEKDADAAVLSSYAMPLLEGCGAIEKGELRIVGTTDPLPFIGVFATDLVRRKTEAELMAALKAVRNDAPLLVAMESKEGFLRLPAIRGGAPGTHREWNDWRGEGRGAISDDVPTVLPKSKRLLWSRTLTGQGMSGLAVAGGRLIVADKNLDDTRDIFRCLDADTGGERWKITYPAQGKMDFTNSPRATPVIRDGLVYLLGAFGDLHCVRLATGDVVWRKHLADDFGAPRPKWGYVAAPLVVDDKLIVNPGAQDASLVALDRHTGDVRWRTPGDPPAYACFILAQLGGLRQIVGYDEGSLGGWDPETGTRLWRMVPREEGDFNVPTPIAVDGKILVATEGNGVRLFGFEGNGRIRPEPLAVNELMVPDTSTPVVLGGMVLANCGLLMCADLEDGLQTLWEEADDDDLIEYCTFIAGNGHVLITSQTGKLYLVKADKRRFQCVATLNLFDDVPQSDRVVWSHPALVGNRLYVRNQLGVYCFLLE